MAGKPKTDILSEIQIRCWEIFRHLTSEIMRTPLLIFACGFSVSSSLLTHVLKHTCHDFRIISQATNIKNCVSWIHPTKIANLLLLRE
jgi:hypothetical protein